MSIHATPLHAGVDLEKQGEDIIVTVDGKPFGIYTVAQQLHHPYFREIRAPDGTLLTRTIASPGGDHPHHTGVWHAADKINDIKFWHLEGRIENTSIQLLNSGKNPAILRVENRWLDPDDFLVLREQTTIRIYSNRLLLYNISLTAGNKDVNFGDTEEGFFAFRMVDSLSEESTGKVINADGYKTARGCWGRTSDWVDYYGEVDSKVYGSAIFDHPGNFRRARYHVRSYGLFTISPFGEGDYTQGRLPAQPVLLASGSTLKLRYGIYFHAGDTEAGRVSEVFREFLGQDDLDDEEGVRVREVLYPCSADDSDQPAMFYAPVSEQPVPLLVALHTWSSDYRQEFHSSCAKSCLEKGWAYIHPHFRGPNRRPEATGSELVVQDIVDAVAYASQQSNIDPTRIYLVGTSGGGYTALLMAGRKPEIWAGVSAWVPIVDLASWYHENKAMGDKHWREVADSCGGPPGASNEVDHQYEVRSPITWLNKARCVNIDINAGIRDGHEGSVPVSHALRAFNEIAHKQDRFTEAEINYFVREARVPPHLHQEIFDPTYEDKQPLFRRCSQQARVTLFDGGHELIPQAALSWLEKQRLLTSPTSDIGKVNRPAKGASFSVDDQVIEDR